MKDLIRWLVVALLTSGAPVFAAEEQEPALEEIVVYGRTQNGVGLAASASEGVIDYDDIELPMLLRAGDLLEAVPGMAATQHSGTGKANQYFLRGFNLDHGTDFSASAEGVPLNLRSHAHGQGYLDLNFLIPELVATTRYQKGPYRARVGDFSSAGSVEFEFYDRLPQSSLEGSHGQDGYRRGLALTSVPVGRGNFLGAIDAGRNDGPWQLEENLRQEKLFARYTWGTGRGTARLTFQGYSSEWIATDQIPERAVEAGLVSEFGFVDPDPGGRTDRYALSGGVDFGNWQAAAWLVDYDFQLFSNFTYFLEDPTNGDEFEQHDDRLSYGARMDGVLERYLGGRPIGLRWGAEIRVDDIGEVGLYQTRGRQRYRTIRRDRINERSAALYAELDFGVTRNLRSRVGARIERLGWNVDALRPDNSGSGSAVQVSPKVTMAYRLSERTEAYLNYGRGMHSNDVRGASIGIDPVTGRTADRVSALVPSDGAEIGIRYEGDGDVSAALAVFWLDLDSELVFVGDAGGTDPIPGSRRIGLEAQASWQVTPWLAVNGAYSYTDAALRGTRDPYIPGAISSVFSLGITGAWSGGARASVRLRHLGSAPLVEDGTVRSRGSTHLNLGAAIRRGPVEYRLDLLNALDSSDHDIAYYYASRLSGEPAGGVEDIHFHPLAPRTIRAAVKLLW